MEFSMMLTNMAGVSERPRHMPNSLQDAVKARLEELGRNPSAAATAAGLERGFLSDILIGRKRSVRGESLVKVAAALELSVEELMARASLADKRAPKPPAGGLEEISLERLRIVFAAAFVGRGLTEEQARNMVEILLAFARKSKDQPELELDRPQLEQVGRTLARGFDPR
jgi:hypothetical protein